MPLSNEDMMAAAPLPDWLAEALGGLADQHLSRAGQWGITPEGVRVSSLDSLFPRIEE